MARWPSPLLLDRILTTPGNSRGFPVLLICDEADTTLPCRHSKAIYAAARGPKQMRAVPAAFHSAALGIAPKEFRRRTLAFYAMAGAGTAQPGQAFSR